MSALISPGGIRLLFIVLHSAQPLLNTPFYILHDQVRTTLEEMLEKLPEEFNMVELLGKVEERTPYQVVVLQECERMNILTEEIRESLRELSLGLKVRTDFSHRLVHHGRRLSFLSCCVMPLHVDKNIYCNIITHIFNVYMFGYDDNHGNGSS